jgi:putative colanic acid biosysnthesis UDP-glucose lipid carrier transferase
MLNSLSRLRISKYINPLLFLGDLIILNLAYALALYCTDSLTQNTIQDNVRTFLLLLNLFWMILVTKHDLYELERSETTLKAINKLGKFLVLYVAILVITLVGLQFSPIFYWKLIYFIIFVFIGLLAYRFCSLKLLKYIRSKGFNFKTVAIFGRNENSTKLAKLLAKDLTFGYKMQGYYGLDTYGIKTRFPYLGDVEQLAHNMQFDKLDELYVSMDSVSNDLLQRLIILCDQHMIRLKFIPNFNKITQSKRIDFKFYESIPIINIRSEPLLDQFNQLYKRLFDFVFSTAIILLIFPWLFPILILAIKISSPGSVFFKQLRSGEDNRSFTCYKFRTMSVNNLSDTKQAQKNDSRITKVGAFLRKTNLDEFPQFFNVFLGSMSVVGPRPHMLKHTEQYRNLLSNYLVRHYSKPGITGWAQVCGHRGETKELREMKNRVKFDIYYLENWSFLLDLKIIFLTVKNMITGEEKAF